MSPSLAVCARCGHVFAEQEALDPCPECGSADRTLRREELVVDESDSGPPELQRQVEEHRPGGACDVVRDPLRDGEED